MLKTRFPEAGFNVTPEPFPKSLIAVAFAEVMPDEIVCSVFAAAVTVPSTLIILPPVAVSFGPPQHWPTAVAIEA